MLGRHPSPVLYGRLSVCTGGFLLTFTQECNLFKLPFEPDKYGTLFSVNHTHMWFVIFCYSVY